MRMAVRGQINGKLENTIKRMETGDEGFTLPWALSFEPNKDRYDVFLNVRYPVYPEKGKKGKKGEVVILYIKRTGPKKNDFDVDVDSVGDNFKWGVGKTVYTGANEEDIVNIGQVDIF